MPNDLQTSLSELSNVLFADHTAEELLETVVALARRTLGGADGVSVSLLGAAGFTTSNASDDIVRELDGVQYRDGEGPCVDAIRQARQVSMSVEDDGRRYPSFSAAASERFMTAVLSTPLASGERVLGALNCYSASVGRFPEHDVEIATQFALQASVVLANASSFADAVSTNDQLHQALLSRDLIGQAKGILMERNGCRADEAFDILRRTSQRENRKLTAVAEDVVDGLGGG
jgi:GAF domain-containing protein